MARTEHEDVDDDKSDNNATVREGLARSIEVTPAASTIAVEMAPHTSSQPPPPPAATAADATASFGDALHPVSMSGGVPRRGDGDGGCSSFVDDNVDTRTSLRRRRCRPASSSLLSRLFRHNQEAMAWCLDVTGRTTAVLSLGAFFMPALLQLARIDAGCDPHDRNCTSPTTYGIKPGSWLTATQTVVSVVASPLLPIMGSIVDYTPRRLAKRGSHCPSSSLSSFSPSSSKWSWPTRTFPSSPTNTEDDLRNYTRNFTILSFTFVVLFVAVLVGITAGLHIASDAVLVAHIAMSASFAVATLMLGIAWFRWFRPRPPLHAQVQQEHDDAGSSGSSAYSPPSVWTAGFRKFGRSIRLLAATPSYRPLLWFNVAIAFSDASLQSLPTILITYFTDQLGFTSADVGASVLLLLLAIAPAGFMSAYTTKRLHNNALVILIVTTTIAAIVLVPEPSTITVGGGNGNDTGDGESSSSSSSSDKVKAYVLVVFWGIGNGWKWTADRLASATLCPPQQSGEFMGLYLFSTIVLTWLPPLVFTILNESGVSMQIGLATLNAWFLASAVAYLIMGRYRAAVEAMEIFTVEAAEDSAEEIGPALEERRSGDGSHGRDLGDSNFDSAESLGATGLAPDEGKLGEGSGDDRVNGRDLREAMPTATASEARSFRALYTASS